MLFCPFTQCCPCCCVGLLLQVFDFDNDAATCSLPAAPGQLCRANALDSCGGIAAAREGPTCAVGSFDGSQLLARNGEGNGHEMAICSVKKGS
jgi:hypothetical protein